MKPASVFLLLFCALSVATCQATFVVNGDFEAPTADSGTQTGFGLPGWWIPGGSVDRLGGDGVWHGPTGDGDHFLDMDGMDPGQIEQNVTLEAGVHTIYFALASNPNPQYGGWRGLRVNLDSQYLDFFFDSAGKSYDNMGWVLASATFTVVGEGTHILAFTSFSSEGPVGATLDSVAIDEVSYEALGLPQYVAPAEPPLVFPSSRPGPSPIPPGHEPGVVPEPSTYLAGIGCCLALLGGFVRRVRK